MEKIPRLTVTDVGGSRDKEGDRAYFEREIRSPDDLSKTERSLMHRLGLMLKFNDQPEDQEEIIREAGKFLGKKISEEERKSHGEKGMRRLDAKGLFRAGAYLQQILTKTMIFGAASTFLTHPSFIEEFEKASEGFLGQHGGIESILKGAQAVADFYNDVIESDPDILFAGLNINLDANHGIDILVAKSKERKNMVDQVDLYEIKNNRPPPQEIERIHTRHYKYIQGYKERILLGLGTDESRPALAWMKGEDKETFQERMEEYLTFFKRFVEIDKQAGKAGSPSMYLRTRANKLGIHYLLLATRIKNIREEVLLNLRPEEKEAIMEAKRAVGDLSVSVGTLGLYTKTLLEDPETLHAATALRWNSIVAYRERGGWIKEPEKIKKV